MAALASATAEVRGERPSWAITLANLLPLWLLSLAVMAEGFPRPLFPPALGIAWFVLAIVSAIVLVWKRWLASELLLYSAIPFSLLFTFDEITTTYKTPFIAMCALFLSAGAVGYQRARPAWLRWAILLGAAALAVAMASRAGNNFWRLHEDLNIGMCFIDFPGCPPLPAQAPPWWKLFFG